MKKIIAVVGAVSIALGWTTACAPVSEPVEHHGYNIDQVTESHFLALLARHQGGEASDYRLDATFGEQGLENIDIASFLLELEFIYGMVMLDRQFDEESTPREVLEYLRVQLASLQ
ncbi:hypothetical protein [Shouchella shacheensis]|uniref:hypothetical protein n=1 Tax=Shouchella shacheensis TaxID=1649580 RepID=UPI00073FE2BE|nr:hypothetical protein [Shouchella shacheensis]